MIEEKSSVNFKIRMLAMEALCKFVKIEYKHPFTPLAGANR